MEPVGLVRPDARLEPPCRRRIGDVDRVSVDPETGATIDVDTSDRRVREGYARMVAEQREGRRRLLRRLAIDEIVMRTDGGYVEPLMRFFRSRETRTRRR